MDLTKEEAQLILEALTFTSCVDVCYRDTRELDLKMSELCIKLSTEYKIEKLDNVYLYGDLNYEDPEIAEKYKKLFKDIVEPAKHEHSDYLKDLK